MVNDPQPCKVTLYFVSHAERTLLENAPVTRNGDSLKCNQHFKWG